MAQNFPSRFQKSSLQELQQDLSYETREKQRLQDRLCKLCNDRKILDSNLQDLYDQRGKILLNLSKIQEKHNKSRQKHNILLEELESTQFNRQNLQFELNEKEVHATTVRKNILQIHGDIQNQIARLKNQKYKNEHFDFAMYGMELLLSSMKSENENRIFDKNFDLKIKEEESEIEQEYLDTFSQLNNFINDIVITKSKTSKLTDDIFEIYNHLGLDLTQNNNSTFIEEVLLEFLKFLNGKSLLMKEYGTQTDAVEEEDANHERMAVDKLRETYGELRQFNTVLEMESALLDVVQRDAETKNLEAKKKLDHEEMRRAKKEEEEMLRRQEKVFDEEIKQRKEKKSELQDSLYLAVLKNRNILIELLLDRSDSSRAEVSRDNPPLSESQFLEAFPSWRSSQSKDQEVTMIQEHKNSDMMTKEEQLPLSESQFLETFPSWRSSLSNDQEVTMIQEHKNSDMMTKEQPPHSKRQFREAFPFFRSISSSEEQEDSMTQEHKISDTMIEYEQPPSFLIQLDSEDDA